MGRGCEISAVALFTTTVALAGPAFAAPPVPSHPAHYTIGLEPSYFAGRFGTSHYIRIFDVPLTMSYRHGPVRVRVEVPYLAISGAGVIAGNAVVINNQNAGVRSGVGDLWVKLEYRLNHAYRAVPSVEPYVKVKFPLASYQKGLGTGRFDEEAGLRLTWRVNRDIFPYVQLGYRIVGRLPGLNLLNVFTFEPGVTVAVTPSQYVSALIVGHTAIQRGRTGTAAAVLAYNLRMNFRWELQAYTSAGLTAQTAAFGFGLGVMAHF